MHIKGLLVATLGFVIVAECRPEPLAPVVILGPGVLESLGKGNNIAGQGGAKKAAAADAANLVLKSNLVQTASQKTGINANSADNLTSAASNTDGANFINFCDGSKLTDGQPLDEQSCNGIPMGKIPSADKMVSCVFIEPKDGQSIPVGEAFQAKVKVSNLDAGSFTNATSTYYSAPQNLNEKGEIIGHTHIVIQNLGDNRNPEQPPDPKVFAAFQAVTNEGDGNGLLSTTFKDGLPTPGNYRICTLNSAANHQPVLMGPALRGAQDDCVRFTVVEKGAQA